MLNIYEKENTLHVFIYLTGVHLEVVQSVSEFFLTLVLSQAAQNNSGLN